MPPTALGSLGNGYLARGPFLWMFFTDERWEVMEDQEVIDLDSISRKEAKRLTIRKLFVERMKREGRDKEWYSILKQVKQETGKKYGQVAWEAMRRMGYEGPDKERQLYQEYIEHGEKTKLQRQVEAQRQRIKEEQITDEFEQAFLTLPDKAPIYVEINWIRAHPAMVRRAQARNKLKDILLTKEDILFTPQGPAPSRAAVVALQHWVNHPQQFYKELLSEQIKHKEDKEGTKIDKDIGLEEVRRLLQQVTTRKGGASSPV
jgi:hypothetical protein